MIEEVRRRLLNSPLKSVASELAARVMPAIKLRVCHTDEARVLPGSSKIGGLPDLPATAYWPEWNGKPLSFLAQINLAEVAGYSGAKVLPQSGLLSFFYEIKKQPWGFEPDDKGSWRVFYHDNSADLVEHSPPEAAHTFTACLVEFYAAMTAVPWEFFEIQGLGLTDDDRHAYLDALEGLDLSLMGEPSIQLLGHPHPIQDVMSIQCALASNGISLGRSLNWEHPRIVELSSKALDWRLLFQIASDDSMEMMWGDCGCLYFWITSDALKAREFDKCWMVLQCT